MFLRIGLLILGAFIFIALGWAAVASWITVFTEGAGSGVATTGFSGRDNESPAIIAALFSTVFSLTGAAAVVVVVVDLVKRRRRRRDAPAD